MTYNDLVALAGRLAGQTLTTVRGQAFTVEARGTRLEFTPASTGVARGDGQSAAEHFLARYNETRSLRPGDYADLTRNSSYLVGLIAAGRGR